MVKEAAGYVRVSTEQQRENESHVRQRQRLDDWAESNDYKITIYEDIAISGQDDSREEYNLLMGDPESEDLGEAVDYDVVVVREMSRFGRSLQRVCNDIEQLQDSGVDFVSLKEDIDMTTAQGKLMLHIIAAFNQFWSDWSRERAEEYVETARANGDPLGRPMKIGEDELDDVERWRKGGLSYNEIKKFLYEIHDVEVSRSTVYRTCKRNDFEPVQTEN